MEIDVLPCYVVCDVSCAMAGYVDELNAALRELRGAVHADPVFGAKLYVCVVTFARQTTVVQSLRPACEPVEQIRPADEPGSDFGLVFTRLRAAIDHDVQELKARHRRVSRPALFFVSDGRPADGEWHPALAALGETSWPARPSFIVFGVGAADQDTLARIGPSRLFLGNVRMGFALTTSVLRPALIEDRL